MSHWPAIFEGDGSSASESPTPTFVYFADRGVERHKKGKMVDRNSVTRSGPDQIYGLLMCLLRLL